MNARRYFSASIDELEQAFALSLNDAEALYELLEELQHRDRPRARALALKVAAQITLNKAASIGASRNAASEIQSVPRPQPQSDPQPIISDEVPRGGYRPANDAQLVQNNSHDGHVRESSEGSKPKAIVDFGEAAPIFSDEVSAKPGADSILAAWLTMEVLTPQELPKARDLEAMNRALVRLSEYPEPWNERRFARRGKERAVYWMVYLGELDLRKALDAILKLYPDDMADERSDLKGNTTLAVIVLDEKGCPVEGKTFLSSFSWGYGQVRANRLKGLASFPQAERLIKARFEKSIVRQDEEGNILPLESDVIDSGTDWLAKILNLPDDEVIRPGFAIRVPQQYGRFAEAPEPELLNSFFIGDLVVARTALGEGKLGKGLAQYLGLSECPAKQDVIRNIGSIKAALAPSRFPPTRWPAPGRHPLVLMQQAAINHAAHELRQPGMVSVNGPPGTGKTTLLRDIVAKVVLDRAIALSKFEKPTDAFKHSGSMKAGNAYTHLYQLNESLLGHEIVVASTNNKAVENISREIPSSKAIADDLDPPPRYFQAISDVVAAEKGNIKVGTTWGLAAAVLGNSSNRYAFAQSFYWHKKRGMARYFKAVMGNLETVEDDDESEDDTEDDEQRIATVEELEQPPIGEIEAMERWRRTRRKFLERVKTAGRLQQEAQQTHDAVARLPAAAKALAEADASLIAAQETYTAAVQRVEKLATLVARTADNERKAIDDRDVINRLRPGFFAKLFNTKTNREWRAQLMHRQSIVEVARTQHATAADAQKSAVIVVNDAEAQVALWSEKRTRQATIVKGLEATIDGHRAKMGANLADERFWSQGDSTLQLASPWIYQEWQEARDALFVAAFELQRAFIDAAAKPLKHNISGALELLRGRGLKEKNEAVRRSLWASFFLVVPVISTTFASVARLFGPLGKEQLGWLLIDEAGQAVPQAAVGAMYRASRTVVIGDPLQIQPVVTTPPKLIRSIFSEFDVDTELWAAPEMSVQNVADRVNWFGTNIQRPEGDIWVGCPLRVHRRCENPMFKISNHIAYDGLMVHGTNAGGSPIGDVIGQSVWFDVDSDAVAKWSSVEGVQAVALLRRLMDAGISDPDIYFITPFRTVAQKLREMIRSDRNLSEKLSGNIWKWTDERVGTVHTFQGKEAEAVVIVLGAPLDESAGARRWAGSPSNLLNVAVTRAKRRLYVIGSRRAWRDAGVFSHLTQNLPS